MTDLQMYCLAQWFHAVRMSDMVPGMKGFDAHYYKSLPEGEKELVDRFEKARQQVAEDQIKEHEKEGLPR